MSPCQMKVYQIRNPAVSKHTQKLESEQRIHEKIKVNI